MNELTAEDYRSVQDAERALVVRGWRPGTLNEHVAGWAHLVEVVEDGYTMTVDDYTDDLGVREWLDLVGAMLTDRVCASLRDRLAPLDERFRAATTSTARPLPGCRGAWWCRLPRVLVEELREDALRMGLGSVRQLTAGKVAGNALNSAVAGLTNSGRRGRCVFPAGTMGRVLERRSYAIRDDATEREVASVCKAALFVLWEDLAWFEIDLSGLDQEPECAEAVAALRDRRQRRWLSKKLESSAHLEPGRDDDQLVVVLPLLSRTIGSTGVSRDHARIIFSVDDEGTSSLFDLTSKQLGSVRDRWSNDGVSRDVLIPGSGPDAAWGRTPSGVRRRGARTPSGVVAARWRDRADCGMTGRSSGIMLR